MVRILCFVQGIPGLRRNIKDRTFFMHSLTVEELTAFCKIIEHVRFGKAYSTFSFLAFFYAKYLAEGIIRHLKALKIQQNQWLKIEIQAVWNVNAISYHEIETWRIYDEEDGIYDITDESSFSINNKPYNLQIQHWETDANGNKRLIVSDHGYTQVEILEPIYMRLAFLLKHLGHKF